MKTKNIVVFSDEMYFHHTLNTIESFKRVNDTFNFIYYQIGFDKKVSLYDMNIKCVPLTDLPKIPENLPWNGLMILKPYIINKALELCDEFIYIDVDVMASKHFNYDRIVSKITNKPYGCRLHETEWQYPVHWIIKDGIRIEYNEKGLMDYLGVKDRTQPWVTACMLGVNKSCKDFIQEQLSLSLNEELLYSNKVDNPYLYYFHMGDETIYNVLLWKYNATNYYDTHLIIEPKEMSTIIELENNHIVDRQIEFDNKMTYVYDSRQIAIYHQIKDLNLRIKTLIDLNKKK